jgi:hypothetical protein
MACWILKKKTIKNKLTMAAKTNKWSGEVTEHSNAMDLEQDIFKSGDPDKIARPAEIVPVPERHVDAHFL